MMSDGGERGVGIGLDAAFLDPILDIGFHPVFDPRADAFAADDHRYFGPFSPGLECGVDCGIAGTDDNHFLHGIEMRFLIVMSYLLEVFPGDIHQYRDIVKAGGEDNIGGLIGTVGADDLKSILRFGGYP